MDPRIILIFVVSATVLEFCVGNSLSPNGKHGGVLLEKRRLRADGKPVVVIMKAYILDIEEVNCVNQEVTIELYLQHFWRDPSYDLGPGRRAEVDSKSNTDVWIPDTYVVNARKFDIRKHDITRIGHGELERSEIITVTTKCAMEFSLYPFDHQRCSIDLESYSFTTNDVQYMWAEGGESEDEEAVVILPAAKSVLPFRVMDVGKEATNMTYLDEIYSRVSIQVHLRRHWNTYLESFYVPMTFFASLSLLSLWLVYPKISAMVNFFNISLVNIFLQLYQSNSDLPKLYYKTALTTYSIICYVFIFLTLFLNVYILFYIKTDEDDLEDDRDNRKSSDSPANQGNNSATSTGPRNVTTYIIKSTSQSAAGDNGNDPPDPSNWLIIRTRLMDKCRRNAHWTLLGAFIFAKLIYWITLLSIHYSS